MSIIGSSSILTTGIPGPVGPIGPTGNTGNVGLSAANCENLARGGTSTYITSVKQENNPYANTVFSFSDNQKQSFIYSKLAGSTLFDSYGVLGSAVSTPSIFIAASGSNAGVTYHFKSISSEIAAMEVTSDSDHIYINGPVNPYDAKGFIENELLYFTGKTQDPILDGITGGLGSFRFEPKTNHFSVNTGILTRTIVSTISSAAIGSSGSYIDIRQGGVFYINTPNGILGITGMTGSVGSTGNIITLTVITQSDYIWKFPTNVWFEKGENYLGCGETVINLTSNNKNLNWNATVFGRGFNSTVLTCNSSWDMGSCNYNQGQTCNNYITRADCNLSNGIFCLRSCDLEWEVFDTGSCCINGVCKDNTSKFLCTKYGGRWWSPVQTGNNGCNAFKCWDPCVDGPGSCCPPAGSTCLDRHSKTECDMLSGTWSGEECNPFSCTPLGGSIGACCLGPNLCESLTYKDCAKRGGIFTGIGELCGEVNCDCFNYLPSGIGCGTGISFSDSGVKFSEFQLNTNGFDFTESEGITSAKICFRYKPLGKKDRFFILRTNDADPAIKSGIRNLPAKNYYDNYIPFITNPILSHPRYVNPENPQSKDGTNYDTAIFDSGCTSGNEWKNVELTIKDSDVEIYDNTDQWYKKLRLWVFAGCDPTQSGATKWFLGITCDECPTQSSLALINSVENVNSADTKIINIADSVFKIIGGDIS